MKANAFLIDRLHAWRLSHSTENCDRACWTTQECRVEKSGEEKQIG